MSFDPLQQLEANLRANALNIRKAALDELAGLPAEVAVPLLQRLSSERDFALRRLAVMGLGNHQSPASFELLQRILDQEQDGNVLAEAANSLFEFGDAAIPLLQELFERSQHWLVRQTVISLLLETQHYDVLLEVATEAIADETQTVKEVGILALRHLWQSPFKSQALNLIHQLADDPFWRNRWRAAIALYGCDDPQAKALIAKLQHDEHFRVVAAALEIANH
jgi:HEAT repeat protein